MNAVWALLDQQQQAADALAAEQFVDECWKQYRTVQPTDAMVAAALDAIEAGWPVGGAR